MPAPDGKPSSPITAHLGDAGPGNAAGQGKDDDDGYWYVMRPSG
jgi:hypothetical protein